ncbi:hypothetical protein AAU57_08865 [Nonlabens sp. YIK11]|uniref:hypothetical protein n=1 Tax=Nonlabens sp. YIK11 TaxID=1453349 RepID=UPI0006DCCE87|nr:hypothetical protein [Nonlabens sp. YIK11]KQC33414.1 hypothetical protein AAU57_08865 [Nonlabens sp. YIK11]
MNRQSFDEIYKTTFKKCYINDKNVPILTVYVGKRDDEREEDVLYTYSIDREEYDLNPNEAVKNGRFEQMKQIIRDYKINDSPEDLLKWIISRTTKP